MGSARKPRPMRKAAWRGQTTFGRKPWKRRGWVVGSICLFLAGVSYAVNQTPGEHNRLHHTFAAFFRRHDSAIRQLFGNFPPKTKAERELAEMLCGKEEDIDLA